MGLLRNQIAAGWMVPGLAPLLLVPVVLGLPLEQSGSGAAEYARGLELAGAGRWSEALGPLGRAAAQAPGNPQYQKALGVAYAKVGDHAAAAESLGRACRADSALPDVCYYWGQSLIAMSRFEEALRAFEQAPSLVAPGRLATAEARALEGLGRESAAEARYRAAIQSGDYEAEARLRYGIFLYRRGRAAEALVPLEEAMRLRPQSAETALELGRTYLQLDRLSEAEVILSRAIRLNPSLRAAQLLLDRAQRRREAP